MRGRGAWRACVVITLASLVLPACSPADSTTQAVRTTTRPPSPTASSSAPPTSSAPTSSAPAGPEGQAEAVLAGMDREQQVRQLFVVGVPLADLSAGAPLVRQGVGGLFLAGRSQASTGELATTTGGWQSAAPGPGLWVATDQEGGLVQALQGPGFPRLPTALEQGRLPADRLTALADGMGASLASAGVNLDLAPVADIVPAGTAARNAPIGAFDRQYGATAAEVVPAARTVIEGLAAHGVTATLKHFPGLGRVTGNTDDTRDVVDTVTTADDEQVRAFGTLAGAPGNPFVMASSATYARIDGTRRAAFSSVVLTRVLRDRLGFEGPVISDSMGAAAVSAVPPGERAVRFIAAGGTLVLITSADPLPAMISAVLNRDRKDPNFTTALDDAVRTALVAKARAGLLR